MLDEMLDWFAPAYTVCQKRPTNKTFLLTYILAEIFLHPSSPSLLLMCSCLQCSPPFPSLSFSFQKKSKQGELRIYFSEKPPWKFQICHFNPRNSGEKKLLILEILQICDTPQKFQSQKPRPMEIPHQFFLNAPGISTSFLIDLWNFHMFFLQDLQKFHVLNTPCLDFFWNSPINICD